MNYKGVIFDLDGVICSTDELHYTAWKELAERCGLPFDRHTNERLRGVSRMESLEIILSQGDKVWSGKEKEMLAEAKNTRYRELLEGLTPQDILPGVESTMRELRMRRLRLAIGSSSRNTMRILERLGLDNWFDAVVDGMRIKRSKPDPEVFLQAAAELSLSPAECLVVEDADAGAQAAFAGGMDVACVGPAAQHNAGTYNLTAIDEILEICQ